MKSIIRSVEDFKFKNKNVFLRVDFNVPVKDGVIQDTRRIDEALPTIQYILENEGKIILASHFGRPKGKYNEEFSMAPIAEYLGEVLKKDVILIEEPDSDAPKALFQGLKSTQIMMLENLRFLEGEEGNDTSLASQWASYTDIYINDAFGVSHRKHCSVDALPRLIKDRGMGFLIKKEIKYLSGLQKKPESPFCLILGGAKVSDKINIIENLLLKVDTFVVGGAMAYTFLKAQGIDVGSSLVEENLVSYARDLLRKLEYKNKKMLLPVDHIISKDLKNTQDATESKHIPSGFMGLDIGPKTLQMYAEELKKAKTVLWNGPMGVFEVPEFANGTQGICEVLSGLQGATTVVGGGDSASAAQMFGGTFTHISTGGGASLEYLEGKVLPGLKSLELTREEIAGLQRVEWVAAEYEDLEEDEPSAPASTVIRNKS